MPNKKLIQLETNINICIYYYLFFLIQSIPNEVKWDARTISR